MAIIFDGTDDCYTVADTPDLDLPDSDWCVGLWVRSPSAQVTAPGYILSNGLSGADKFYSLNINQTTDFLEFRIRDASSDVSFVVTTTAIGGSATWHMIVASRTGDVLSVQVAVAGGTATVEDTDTDSGVQAIEPANELFIGKRSDSHADRFFGGEIAELFFARHLLTDAEVTALAHGVPVLDIVDPIAYWPMYSAVDPLPELISSHVGTLVAAPTTVEHPPVNLAFAPQYINAAAAAAPAAGPTLRHPIEYHRHNLTR